MRVAANLNMLFGDIDLLAKYEKVSSLGFKLVEVSFPYGKRVEELEEASKRLDLQHVLINTPPGDESIGGRGLAALSSQKSKFNESIELAIKYAKTLNCPRVHVMAGLADSRDQEAEKTYKENIRYACERLEKEKLICLIEPINRHTIPGYFLNDYDQALQLIDELAAPNLKILFDVFHAQQICGQLTEKIGKLKRHIGHIQIAQVPSRLGPDTPGEIDFGYLFGVLRRELNDCVIGCEYKEGTNFDWVHKNGLNF